MGCDGLEPRPRGEQGPPTRSSALETPLAAEARPGWRWFASGGGCGGQCLASARRGLWGENPVLAQTLGICSALAVTRRLETAVVMGCAVAVVTACAAAVVSLLRRLIPRRVRMVAQITIIATFVVVLDQVLKAFYGSASRQLGPYVGLIVTNCLVMGRCEAFAMRHGPALAAWDGLTSGLGYALVLAAVGLVRELAGSGQVLGWTVLAGGRYTPNLLASAAPGAFFTLAAVLAACNALRARRGYLRREMPRYGALPPVEVLP